MREIFKGTLLAKINALQLPDSEGVVLNSSGAFGEWGVIPIESVGDIDATLSSENIDALRERVGWKLARKVVGVSRRTSRHIEIDVLSDENQVFDFHRWNFSHFDHYHIGRGRHSLEMQKELSVQDPVTGVYVARPEYVARTKLMTGREKDVRLLEQYREWHRQQIV